MKQLSFLIFLVLTVGLGCNENPAQKENSERKRAHRPDIPTFDGSDTIEFINQVRRFVATTAKSGNINHPLCSNFDTIGIDDFPLAQYLNLFYSNEGTSTCGLTAAIMAKILFDNGLDAYIYNFGFDGTSTTHVVTLVKHQGDFLIFDAHTNFELLNSARENLGILGLLNGIAKNSAPPIYHSDTVMAELILDTSTVTEVETAMLHSNDFHPLVESLKATENGRLTTEFGRCFNCSLNPMGVELKKAFEEKLRQETQFTEFHEAFALKINRVSGAADADSVDRLIEIKLVDLGLKPAISTYTVQ